MGTKNKAHLIYLTGLSVDKKRMNNITENINFDKDFTYLLSLAQENLKGMFNKKNKILSSGINVVKKIANRPLEDILPDTNIISDNSFFNTYEGLANEEVEEGILKRIKALVGEKIISTPIEKTAGLVGGYKSIDKILEDHVSLKNIMKKYQGSIKEYVNGDFFSLYLANQSDTIGVEPLSKLSAKQPYNIEHAYCDWDYYDNKYIDHVILKVNTENLKDNWDLELSKVFNIHVNDILLSRIIEETKIKSSKHSSNKKLSLMDLVLENNDQYSKSDILKTLSDRNFFGISLLSQILYTLKKLSKDNIPLTIKNNENIADVDSGQYHFLKELLEMSSDSNTNIENCNSEAVISAQIYFSDGIKLTKNINTLIEDEFFLYTNKANNENIYSLINDRANKDFLKVQLLKENIHTISYEGKEHKNIINRINQVNNGYVYIKVPVKLMLSLPLDRKEKVNSDLYLPACLVNEKEKVVDVLTVGGAEHNRGLAHLINKHRMKYGNERLFGFMDNYFDFEHKMNLDSDKEDIDNSYNFFMGLNQPVSGWNYLLARREDDKDGNSINNDVKLITFKLKDKNQKINIVSIYGFSATSSVLGVNLFIEEVRHNNFNITEGIFSSKFTSFFDESKIENPKGTTATIFFYKNLKDIAELRFAKRPLFNHFQIVLKDFNQEQEKLLRKKLGDDLSSLIVSSPVDKKYKLEIDINYEDRDEEWILKDKLETLEPKDIKIGQIKEIVRFFFDNRCYLSMFNNDLKKYSKILYYDKAENHLLIRHIQRGRVSAKN